MAEIGVQAQVAHIMARYDRNQDGKINLKGNDAAYSYDATSEKVAICREVYESSGVSYSAYGRRYNAANFKETKADLSALFIAANKDGDGYATRQEVAELIASYDANEDGKLANPFWSWAGGELGRLFGEFAEKITHNRFSTELTGKVDGRGNPIYKDPGGQNTALTHSPGTVFGGH